MKILNLYAGIGGNRVLWENVEVTAVEYKPEIAELYKEFHPNDNVIIGDAHKYLIEHYKDGWDFIWASPPCPTHSRFNFLTSVQEGKEVLYPDMSLWQEIIFLKHWFKGKFCVENVITYYEPLIHPIECNSHYFWTNFHISAWKNTKRGIRGQHADWREERLKKWFDLTNHKITKALKRKVLNNCVEPELGLHILNESKTDIQSELFK